MAEQRDEQVVQAWNAHRPYLIDLAYRMLGDIGAAEDVVQDAFARMLRSAPGDIEDDRGWLIVVTSRLCLDQIRSAWSRRERAHDATSIEFVGPAEEAWRADPADRVTLDDSVRLALLVVLQRLSPAERVVFVLHDVFQMPFGTIAETVGRSIPACRQLAHRARQKIASGSAGPRFDVASAEHHVVTQRFIAACVHGDLPGLLAVLAPDAWGDVDLGAAASRPRIVQTGADRVARNLLRLWTGATMVSQPAGGQPAVLGFRGRELVGVLVLHVRDERVQAVHAIADPAKLAFVSAQLAAPG